MARALTLFEIYGGGGSAPLSQAQKLKESPGRIGLKNKQTKQQQQQQQQQQQNNVKQLETQTDRLAP